MPVTSIHVEYEKRANDGDYGSELVKLSWTYDLQDGEDPIMVTAALQGEIRGRVESDLAQSANLKVRRALIRQTRTCSRCGQELADSENGYLHPDCKVAEDAERQARYDERRRKEQAEDEAAADDDDEDLPL